jgi:hypothetical protein
MRPPRPVLCLFSTRHCSLSRLIVRFGLNFPTFATRRLLACQHASAPRGGKWNCGREMSGNFCLNVDFHVTFRELLHAVKLRHVTDGFTFPLKKGVLRIFFILKIPRLWPDSNPRTWVPKTSTLPLEHRSRYLGRLLDLKVFEISLLWPPSLSFSRWDSIPCSD